MSQSYLGMRRLGIGFAALAALAASTSASAAITLTGNIAATNVYSGPTPTYTFEVGSRPPNSGGAFVAGAAVPHVPPTGTGPNDFYYSAGPGDTTPGTLDLSVFGDIFNISFVWGSVDLYNTLVFLDAANNPLKSFIGSDVIPGATGIDSRLVTFTLSGVDVSAFAKLQLQSTTNAFEIDNLAINAVPEPGTWALMMLGFGAMGLALRGRRRKGLAQIA